MQIYMTIEAWYWNDSLFFVPQDRVDRVPDLMEYFIPDLQKESANWNVCGVPEPQTNLQTTDLHRAFDVYKHVRVWENW